MLDIFKSDAFSFVSLTAAIEKLPIKWGRIGQLGLFRRKPITTTTAVVEEWQGKLSLLKSSERGTASTAATRPRRVVRSFNVPHFPLNDQVQASEVQNVRSFGSEDVTESVAELVTDRLQSCKDNHEITHEFLRYGAIKGQLLDGDGTSVLYDLFEEFGITERTSELGTGDNVQAWCKQLTRDTRDALGASVYTGLHAFCSDGFFDDFVSSSQVKDAYNRWRDGEFFRNQQQAFEFCGITWENYHPKVGNVDFIEDGKARLFPLGVADLFQEINSPANFIEAVNTPGKPYYAKQQVQDFETGVDIHTQSNPLMLCTRPGALTELTLDLGS